MEKVKTKAREESAAHDRVELLARVDVETVSVAQLVAQGTLDGTKSPATAGEVVVQVPVAQFGCSCGL